MSPELWKRVGELADQAPDVAALRHHRLQLVAISRMRGRGTRVPPDLLAEERRVAALHLAVPTVLRRVRAACDGPLLLMKGAEVAARWPQPRLRPANDVDLLVEDARAVQADLLAAGFVELDDRELYSDFHHLCPLGLPGVPLTVEVHSKPHWDLGTTRAVQDILTAATPSVLGVDGILAPNLEHHAVLLAAHAWAHGPLARIGSLVDVAVMLEGTDRDATAAVAQRWGLANIWRATTRAIDEFLADDRVAKRVPLWQRHLTGVRERTVFEEHVTRIVAPVVAAPIKYAPMALAQALASAFRPSSGEDRAAKLRRSGLALRHAAWTKSQHEATLAAPPTKGTG
jgi:hypothetical protein